MATVNLKEDNAASQAEEQSLVLTDSKGRKITLRELDPLQESRVFIAVGSQNASNSTYMSGYAFPAAMVESIDDVDYSVPVNQAQIDGRLKHLGKEGMLAIRQYMMDAIKNAGLDDESDAAETAAKN